MKKKYLISLVFGMIALTAPMFSRAEVLTFDELGDAVYMPPVPAGYGGLLWSGMYYMDPRNGYVGTGYYTGMVSPYGVAFNGGGGVGILTGDVFDFNGTYLTGAWKDGLCVELTGFLNGVQQYQQTVSTSVAGPTWFDLDFLGIDTLTLRSFGGVSAGLGNGDHFVMDNFTINEAAPVPEPATMLLLGTGLAGLGGIRLRRNRT